MILQVLFSLLGGVALVLLPTLFLSYASEERRGVVLLPLGLLTLAAFLGALYLAVSFWLFGFFPIFLLSFLVTFLLLRHSSHGDPDFVVEKTLLDQSLSSDLEKRLDQEIAKKEE